MICRICGQVIRDVDDRHNAEPVASGVCCNWCNYTKVIPTRLQQHEHLIDTINL